ELIGVPQFQTAYHGELKKENWGLVHVPKMHVYKGSIWACWDPEAPDWDAYMGDMKLYLDALFEGLDGDPGGREVYAGVQKWIIPTNSKFPAANFLGDAYHASTTHRSASLSNMANGDPIPKFGGAGFQPRTAPVSVSFNEGHGVLYSYHPDDWSQRPDYENHTPHRAHADPVINDYF